MSEISPNIAVSIASRRPIRWAIALGLVLLPLGALVAVLGVILGLVAFNGCYGAMTPIAEALSIGWLIGVWPLSVLVTALVPPVLLGRGRGSKAALIAFVAGLLVSILVWFAWIPIGYALMC